MTNQEIIETLKGTSFDPFVDDNIREKVLFYCIPQISGTIIKIICKITPDSYPMDCYINHIKIIKEKKIHLLAPTGYTLGIKVIDEERKNYYIIMCTEEP